MSTIYVCAHNKTEEQKAAPCLQGCHDPYSEPVTWRSWPETWRADGFHDAEGIDAAVMCTACGGSLAEKVDGAWGDGRGHTEDCPTEKPLPVPPHAVTLLCPDCGTGFTMPGWLDPDAAVELADDQSCPACGAGELVVFTATRGCDVCGYPPAAGGKRQEHHGGCPSQGGA